MVSFLPLVAALALMTGPGTEMAARAAEPPLTGAGGENAEPAAKVSGPLVGTSWRLVSFQSMDDAQGTRRPTDPSRYTLKFGADGRVRMRLDCNRAVGSWSVQPSKDPSSGGLRFGPLAATRAICSPPSLGEFVGAQSTYVRSYLLKDGRLHLSLLADGGIFTYEPLDGVPYSGSADGRLEQALRQENPAYRKDVVGDSPRARYVHARIDLNGDGQEDVLAYLMGPFFCGTGGCTLQLFQAAGPEGQGSYRAIQALPLTRLPLIVSPERTRGWSDLWKLESGGGAQASYVRYAFDGRRYVEKERAAAEPSPAGTPVFLGEPSFDDGAPLEPGG